MNEFADQKIWLELGGIREGRGLGIFHPRRDQYSDQEISKRTTGDAEINCSSLFSCTNIHYSVSWYNSFLKFVSCLHILFF
jgi:hypothetical protein